ncbi:alpha/beta fold hydrolase [Bordetella petrii]|nr:alpha/beta fold hydrolase [Bordetella petrii]
MPFLERAGAPAIHYEYDDYTDPWKNAPILLLQHGYSRSAQIWYQWIPYLARHYRVIRMDLRGLGRSPADFDLQTEMSAQHFIDDILAVIDAHGGGPVHYCGESLGGILGMLLAADHPDKLRTLTLISAPLRLSARTRSDFACGHASWQEALRVLGSEEWSARVNTITRFPPGTDPQLMDWYAKETGKSNVDALIRLSEIACSADVESCLPRITVPTLGLYPMKGPITVNDDDVILKTIPNMRMVRLPTTYHAIQFLMPAACAKEVLHFATQHDGVSSHE